jgi:hypothetical protein
MKKPVTQLREKHGVWVFRSGERLTQVTVDKTIRKIRKEREKRLGVPSGGKSRSRRARGG